MPPPKSRDQLLVSLANSIAKDGPPIEVFQADALVEAGTSESPQSISFLNDITDRDLEYSVEFQNSRCSGILSDALPEINL